tara:strand:+ start:121 stop:582 length:462 start_codon:yes stop_codon:yes gene_type:complete
VEHLAHREHLVVQGHLVHLALQQLQQLKVHKVNQAQEVDKEAVEILVQEDNQVNPHKVVLLQMVNQVNQVQMGNLVLMAHLVVMGHLVHLAHQVNLVHLVHLVVMVNLVHLVHLVKMVLQVETGVRQILVEVLQVEQSLVHLIKSSQMEETFE